MSRPILCGTMAMFSPAEVRVRSPQPFDPANAMQVLNRKIVSAMSFSPDNVVAVRPRLAATEKDGSGAMHHAAGETALIPSAAGFLRILWVLCRKQTRPPGTFLLFEPAHARRHPLRHRGLSRGLRDGQQAEVEG